MTTSLRLLLEDFLGLMREEGELDVYLPLLLSAMGHELVYRAQKGTRQYGVDISSVGKDENGKKKLFLWLVKCGDINRQDWDSGPQAIRQSINDVGDTYLASHVAPQHARLPKKLCVVTNGDFNASLNQTIVSFLKSWSEERRVEAATVNGSTLAAWTERFLLDEYVLPPATRVLLRRMLANVGSPELSIAVGQALVAELVKGTKTPAKSVAARKKRQLTGLRAIRTALSVLRVWAQSERNLLAPYRLAEFAVLSVWAALHAELQLRDRNVSHEFAELLIQTASIAEAYHETLQPYYLTQDAFARALPDSLLVTDIAFQELGRLGLQGCIWAFLAKDGDDSVAEGQAGVYVERVLALLKSHTCTQSPAYDHHSIDIHVTLLLLLIGNCGEAARQWVRSLALRLAYVAKTFKYWPLTAAYEDTLLIRWGYGDVSDEFKSTSTLVPLLLLWAAILGMDDVYRFIRENVLSAIPETTLNFWSSDVGFDDLVADPVALSQHGVGESVLNVPIEPEAFLSEMSTPLAEVDSIEQARWYKLRAAYIPLLAAVYWRLQVPREMLVRHAMAVASHSSQRDAGTTCPEAT